MNGSSLRPKLTVTADGEELRDIAGPVFGPMSPTPWV